MCYHAIAGAQENKIKWSLVCMYDMSFECYYDHNKQQFIHKIELILIAAVAVTATSAVADAIGLDLDHRTECFFLLFYFSYFSYVRAASKSCGASERPNTIWITTNVIRSVRAVSEAFWICCFMLFSRSSAGFRLNIMLITRMWRGNFFWGDPKYFWEDSLPYWNHSSPLPMTPIPFLFFSANKAKTLP